MALESINNKTKAADPIQKTSLKETKNAQF